MVHLPGGVDRGNSSWRNAVTHLCVVLLEFHVSHNHLSLIVILGLKLLPLDVETCQSHHLTMRCLQPF